MEVRYCLDENCEHHKKPVTSDVFADCIACGKRLSKEPIINYLQHELKHLDRLIETIDALAQAWKKTDDRHHRFLIYPIGKDQGSPILCHDFAPVQYKDAREGLTVIVDLDYKRRYFLGEWSPIEYEGDEKVIKQPT